jgi:hypothetical protein
MIRDISALETHEKMMHDMDEEQRATLPDQLETIEQRNYDHELLQMDDDIIQNLDDETARFTSAFENLDHSDSADNSDFYDRIQESRENFFRDLSHLPDEACSDDPDSDDDDEEVIDLLQSNMRLTIRSIITTYQGYRTSP